MIYIYQHYVDVWENKIFWILLSFQFNKHLSLEENCILADKNCKNENIYSFIYFFLLFCLCVLLVPEENQYAMQMHMQKIWRMPISSCCISAF